MEAESDVSCPESGQPSLLIGFLRDSVGRPGILPDVRGVLVETAVMLTRAAESRSPKPPKAGYSGPYKAWSKEDQFVLGDQFMLAVY